MVKAQERINKKRFLSLVTFEFLDVLRQSPALVQVNLARVSLLPFS